MTCGGVQFPLLRAEAWQKIFRCDCAAAGWPPEFPRCPPPMPEETPLQYSERLLPLAREVLPVLHEAVSDVLMSDYVEAADPLIFRKRGCCIPSNQKLCCGNFTATHQLQSPRKEDVELNE